MKRHMIAVSLLVISTGNAADFSSQCKTISSQLARNECAAQEYNEFDKALNVLYSQLQKQITTEADKKELKKAQLAWITYKELDCAQVGARYFEGSLYNYIVNTCYSEKTEIRIKELKRLINLRDEM